MKKAGPEVRERVASERRSGPGRWLCNVVLPAELRPRVFIYAAMHGLTMREAVAALLDEAAPELPQGFVSREAPNRGLFGR